MGSCLYIDFVSSYVRHRESKKNGGKLKMMVRKNKGLERKGAGDEKHGVIRHRSKGICEEVAHRVGEILGLETTEEKVGNCRKTGSCLGE